MREKIQVVLISVLFLAISAFAWLKPADDVSDSELRKLAQMPQISTESVLSGKFMKDFETYTLDQFPFREKFRSLKAVTYLYGLRQLDNNGIYIQDGYTAKMEYPLNQNSLDHAIKILNSLYDQFIRDTDASCYLSVIPDKNYFLADSHGALKLDYDQLIDYMKQGTSFAEYISLTDILTKEDYYRTDTHWNQVALINAANRLAGSMGSSLMNEYETVDVKTPFYGVYYGQAALPMAPDRMQYLTNDVIRQAKVYDWENDAVIPVYDETKMDSRSPYDLFLGGSLSMITIENENAQTDKELVIFRDSFGSSITPLLISGYRKITVFDIRYLPHARIGNYIQFKDQDVLFLYSTLVLNNSAPLK